MTISEYRQKGNYIKQTYSAPEELNDAQKLRDYFKIAP